MSDCAVLYVLCTGWEIQNSTKTDRNLFFASKNLLQLEAQLDAGDAGARGAAFGGCY
jgi:hypothetical protein